MSQEQIVQIRKKGGLHTIKSNAGVIIPKVFHQDKLDPNGEGAYTGDYRGQTILKTKRYICPMWEDLTNQWGWGSTPEKLMELINAMKLRYPEKHENAGQIIKCKSNQEAMDRLTYRLDPLFNHPELYKFFLEDARLSLNMKDPLQEFLFYCMKGSTIVDNKTGEVKSGFITAGMQFELVSPKQENKRKKEDVQKEVQAFVLFDKLTANEDKMRAIAEIMQLPGYSKSTASSALIPLMRDHAVTNVEVSSRFGKSYMDRFIELAKTPDEELETHSIIIKAKKSHKLVPRSGYYMFQGKKLKNVTNDIQLVNYFLDPNNQDDYLELMELMQ